MTRVRVAADSQAHHELRAADNVLRGLDVDGVHGEEERGEACTHRRIRAFDVAPDGSLSNNQVFADMSSVEQGVPDGMKVDVQGNVFCTGNGGTCVFDKEGRYLGTIRTPEIPANCAFGGSDLRTLFFTARTSVYRGRVKGPGVKVPRVYTQG